MKGFMSPSYKIMSLVIEMPGINYALEPCELVLPSLSGTKTHTTADSCLDLVLARVALVLPPFFYYNGAQDTGCPSDAYRPWVLAIESK